MKKTISLALILVLVAATLVGCGGGGASYTDGTYPAEVTAHNGPLAVEVTVTDGAISNVEVTSHEETEGLADPALEEIPALIVEKNSTDVDAISGVTVTSDAIKDAVNKALESAQ